MPGPIRPATNWKGDNFLGKDPASTTIKHRSVDRAAHAKFAAPIPPGLPSPTSGVEVDGTPLPGPRNAAYTSYAPIAVVTNRVALCRVDASYGAVRVGDRLVASPIPGVAMKADLSPVNAMVLGRAIEPLEAGSALIRVLVTVR